MIKLLRNATSINIIFLALFIMSFSVATSSYGQDRTNLRYSQRTEIGQQKFLDDFVIGMVRGIERSKKSMEEQRGSAVIELLDASGDASTDTVQVKIKYLIDDYDVSIIESIPLAMCSNPGTAFIINQGINYNYEYLDPKDKAIISFTLTEKFCTQTLLENGVSIDKAAYDKIASNFDNSSVSEAYKLGEKFGTSIGYLLIFLLIIGIIALVTKKSKSKNES